MSKIKESDDKIIELYKSGCLLSDIVEKVGVSMSTVSRVIKRNNIPLRGYVSRIPKPPKHDLTGQKFNYLTVLKMAITEKSKSNTWMAVCKCDCGNINDYPPSDVINGRRKTCGKKDCKFHRQDYSNCGKNNVRFTGYEGIHGQKWSVIKAGAKKRKIGFDISIEYAWNLFVEQDKKCALTGMNIEFGKTATDFEATTASLDRIDSSIGYVEGNVQWVHKNVNLMKSHLGQREFVDLCKMVASYKS